MILVNLYDGTSTSPGKTGVSNGDIYINVNNGDVYNFSSSANNWNTIGTIHGSKLTATPPTNPLVVSLPSGNETILWTGSTYTPLLNPDLGDVWRFYMTMNVTLMASGILNMYYNNVSSNTLLMTTSLGEVGFLPPLSPNTSANGLMITPANTNVSPPATLTDANGIIWSFGGYSTGQSAVLRANTDTGQAGYIMETDDNGVIWGQDIEGQWFTLANNTPQNSYPIISSNTSSSNVASVPGSIIVGTINTPNTLTDGTGAMWSFGGLAPNAPILKNGTQFANGTGGLMVLDASGVIWVQNNVSGPVGPWFMTTNTGFVSEGSGPDVGLTNATPLSGSSIFIFEGVLQLQGNSTVSTISLSSISLEGSPRISVPANLSNSSIIVTVIANTNFSSTTANVANGSVTIGPMFLELLT